MDATTPRRIGEGLSTLPARCNAGIQNVRHLFRDSSALQQLGRHRILGEEIDPVAVRTFERVRQYPPLGIDVFTGSLDIRNIGYAQMVFVQRDNPLTNISLVELAGILGEEHRRGAANIRTWGRMGLTGAWADEPITPYSWRIDDSFGIFLQD